VVREVSSTGGKAVVQQRGIRLWLAAAFAAALGFTVGCEARDTEVREDVPPAAATDPSAERQFIRLAGCVKPDADPGKFVLAGVSTAGVIGGAAGDEKQQARSWTTDDEASISGQASAIAASSYQLIVPEGEDMSEFANKRVIVTGILAHETPVGTSGRADADDAAAASPSREAQRDTSSSKVTADSAPSLRGLHVESVNRVADSCGD
jgi:hypothetical protein